MNTMPTLNDKDYHTLTNALMTAADTFAKNAKDLRAMIPSIETAEAAGKTPFITAGGAEMLAEQFDQQVKDTRAVLDKIEGEEG